MWMPMTALVSRFGNYRARASAGRIGRMLIGLARCAFRRLSFPCSSRFIHSSPRTMVAREYKVKIDPADVQVPLSKVEVELDGTDSKVLLLNVKGELRAISPKCTRELIVCAIARPPCARAAQITARRSRTAS